VAPVVPVQVRVTLFARSSRFVEKNSVPVKFPACVGMHATSTWHILPANSEPSHVSAVLMKGAVVLMLLNLIVKPLKVLVAVTVCEELVVPTLTLPKARLVGLTTRSAAEAGFAAASPNAKRRKKLKTENAKMDDFGRNMINPPESNPVITNASEGTHHHFQTSEASIVFSNRRQIRQPSLA